MSFQAHRWFDQCPRRHPKMGRAGVRNRSASKTASTPSQNYARRIGRYMQGSLLHRPAYGL